LRREGLRGQAWIIFDSVQSATAALQAENGFHFFGKDLKVQYAKETSDRIAKRDGTYVPKSKRRKTTPIEPTRSSATSTKREETHVDIPKDPGSQPPTHILFAQDLPAECNQIMLEMLFRQYTGFKEVRIPREGLAFIEFDDEPHATLALQGLNGFKLTTDDSLALSYGKS
jgi:RNA recognition motif-containing protein